MTITSPSCPRIESVVLREIQLPFVDFFETSFGRVYEKQAVLVEVQAGGASGWGECVAAEAPFFSYEDHVTGWYILSAFLVPLLLQMEEVSPALLRLKTQRIRGHPMAKAALESALWDLAARNSNVPLWRMIGGVRREIPCGVSIGIQDRHDELIEKISREVEAGYRRIKVKVRPGWDIDVLERIRAEFPSIPLMVDANAAYDLSDAGHLAGFDRFDLMMIEQPLAHDDLLDHSRLTGQLKTPVCLDESIGRAHDAALALELEACSIINIKQGRVGGLLEAAAVHDLCLQRDVPVWCGGMLETGVGRAHNVALSTLPGFVLPGDVSASSRYFTRDVIDPPVEVVNGVISAPESPGIGYTPNVPWIEEITVRKEAFSCREHR